MSTTVTVNLSDRGALADMISDRDTGKVPPTVENISACHDLIIKMMGPHASEYYASEHEEAEAEARAKIEAEAKAKEAAEAKPIPEGDGIVNDTINQADFNKVFGVSEQPAVHTGNVRPTAQSIINLVAKTYNVDTATANRWLAQSFGELKAA